MTRADQWQDRRREKCVAKHSMKTPRFEAMDSIKERAHGPLTGISADNSVTQSSSHMCDMQPIQAPDRHSSRQGSTSIR